MMNTSGTDTNSLLSVIVLAAGQGTRMKSDLPKVTHPLAGLSMIGHVLRAAKSVNPQYLLTVVRHQRDLVSAEVLEQCPDAVIVDQDEIPGTGRAVQCAIESLAQHAIPLTGTVMVVYGDMPLLSSSTLEDLTATHVREGNAVTIATAVLDNPKGYGRIIKDPVTGDVYSIVEESDLVGEQADIHETNAGIYAFDVAFLVSALNELTDGNSQGELYLTDVPSIAYAAGLRASTYVLQDLWEAQGCNDRVQLADMAEEMNRRICRAHQLTGVTIEAPCATRIDVDVTIGKDTTVRLGTALYGKTSIGDKCEIGPGSTLTDAKIGDSCVVPHSWVSSVDMQGHTVVVPFSVIE